MSRILNILYVGKIMPASLVAVTLAFTTLVASTPADAQPWGWGRPGWGGGWGWGRPGWGGGWGWGRPGWGGVGWRGGWGWRGGGWGWGGALAGAAIGYGLASPYYGYGYGYGYPYGYGYTGLYSYSPYSGYYDSGCGC